MSDLLVVSLLVVAHGTGCNRVFDLDGAPCPCASGWVCNASGVCRRPADNGVACVAGGDCVSGHCECADAGCIASVCSATACDCAFNLEGDGICDGFLPLGTQDVRTSCGESACDGTGSCLPLWWDTTFGYRRRIVVHHELVIADLQDFPILIHLDGDADLAERAQDDGDDIAFVAAGSKLDHELEAFDGATGELVAWVRVPSLSSIADTVLYLYYGNVAATNQQAVSATWAPSFRGIWHMDGDPTAVEPQQRDSTSNANGGNCRGEMIGDQRIDGQIGASLHLDGVDDAVQVADSASYDVTSISVSAWVRKTSINDGSYAIAVSRQLGSGDADVWLMTYSWKAGNAYQFCDESTCAYGPVSSDDLGRWVYVVGTNDGTTTALYRDGVLMSVEPVGATLVSDSSGICIGAGANDATRDCASDFMGGDIDEVRLADVARSPEWIATEFANQSSPSTFYQVEPEEGRSEPIARWRMDVADTVGGKMLDVSGNGYDAQIMGEPSSVEGMVGEALTFDGVDDFLDTSFIDVPPRWTVAVWTRGTFAPGSAFDTGPVMTDHSVLVAWDHSWPDARHGAAIAVDGLWYAASFGALEGGTWYHLAATYDGDTLKTYTDGALVTENSNPSGNVDASTSTLKIARHATEAFFFSGALDDVRIYDRAVSAAELARLAQRP